MTYRKGTAPRAWPERSNRLVVDAFMWSFCRRETSARIEEFLTARTTF